MTHRSLEVLFSPAEFNALPGRDLRQTTCVVFDVLRATSSIVSALANGADAVLPVETIEEAVRLKQDDPDLLLAGERDGLRITKTLTGSIDFDFGNSPREFIPGKVEGRRIAMTTTNGTRALNSVRGAFEVLAGSFLNLDATVRHLRSRQPDSLLLVCSGTNEEASYEDTLGAGAVADALWDLFAPVEIADSAQIARNCYLAARGDLLSAMNYARNGRRLLEMEQLRDDVAFCLQRDTISLVAAQRKTGAIQRLGCGTD